MFLKKIIKIITFVWLLTFFTACLPGFLAQPTTTALPPTVTPTPVPRTFTICLGQEPDSLYLYGTVSPASQRVLDVIYFGSPQMQDGKLTSLILERIPSFESGDVSLDAVDVKNGDEIVDADGNLATLSAGLAVFPHGCTSAECVQTWDGTSPLQMDQLKVRFQLREGLQWSDGKPLSSADSIYSFKIASDSDTPVSKAQIDLTASYSAVDGRTIQWVGKAGYLTTNFEKIFWLPLPMHLWEKIPVPQLLTSAESSKQPIGWGPYLIQSWTAGEMIHMVKNPNYGRANEGLPRFDFLDFIFLKNGEDPFAAVKAGKCDLVDSTGIHLDNFSALVESQKDGQLKAIIQPGNTLEFLALGIKPVTYDDSYFPYGTDRPALFDDVRTRQAIAACIDRQGIINKLINGLLPIPEELSFTILGNAGGQSQAVPQSFDLLKADELLTAAGWLDYDKNPATPRISFNVKNVPNGRPLMVSLLSSNSPLQEQIANQVADSLRQCGFAINQDQLSASDLYKPAPDGLIFGRKFDLALLSMQFDEKSICQLFDSHEIPSQLNYWVGMTSGGMNFMGYANSEVDASCKNISRAGMNSKMKTTNLEKVNALINQDLPIIPMFFNPKATIFRNDLCGLKQTSSGWLDYSSLDEWNFGNACSK